MTLAKQHTSRTMLGLVAAFAMVVLVGFGAGSPALAVPDGADSATQIAGNTQVFQRAGMLNVDSGAADAARARSADTIAANRAILPALGQQSLPQVAFDGATLSELGAVLDSAGPAHVTVTSPVLQADTALTITGSDLIVDFSGATIEAASQPPVWLISLVDARNVAVTNATITGGTNGFLVDDSSDIAIDGNDIQNLTQNGIVVTGASSNVHINRNQLRHLDRAGILLHGPVTTALLEGNVIEGLRGHSNWNAGIVLTSRGGDIAADPNTFFLDNDYWVVMNPLAERLRNPEQNVIRNNTIRNNLSSGIYNDGAIANVFLDNRIEANAKEGVCLDNGATANVFVGNLVAANGNRAGQPDEVLGFDGVLDAGRAPDGTALAKLPGISIDNALYNQVSANQVIGNYGGGVKMVRTALFNTVADNVIIDNDLGRSDRYHYFGIELGAAPADGPAVDLDFIGSSGNTISGNTIRGDHYSGIFVASDSMANSFRDNKVDGVEVEAMEFEAR